MESTIEEDEKVFVIDPGGGNVIVESLGASEDEIDCALRRDRTETGTDGNGEREHDRQPEPATGRTLFAATP